MNRENAKKIKSYNTKIEQILENALCDLDFNYSKNDKSVLGKPDFCFKQNKLAVFCDSEFWHGKKFLEGEKFKTNTQFWENKIKQNIARDIKVINQLQSEGWQVLRFWGKEIESDPKKCVLKIKDAIKKSNKIYTCVDLFAGIGGIRLGFEQTSRVKNLFSAEIDKYACKTYEANFKENPYCDITVLDEKKLPDFDILLAGFPCQAFSIAGRRGGFEDTRGTLFFDIARIIKQKRPKAFLLENVKGLLSHNKGKTFDTILNILTNELGYNVYYEILNSKDFGVPQKRERIYIVGFLEKINFKFPTKSKKGMFIENILEDKEVNKKYYLSQTYLNTLKKHKERHKNKGNGFGYEILDKKSIANTLVVGGMGRERNLIYDFRIVNFTADLNTKSQINDEFIRRLTPREWARIQGYPDNFKIPVSDTQAYKQIGNSVSVPVIKQIASLIIKGLDGE